MSQTTSREVVAAFLTYLVPGLRVVDKVEQDAVRSDSALVHLASVPQQVKPSGFLHMPTATLSLLARRNVGTAEAPADEIPWGVVEDAGEVITAAISTCNRARGHQLNIDGALVHVSSAQVVVGASQVPGDLGDWAMAEMTVRISWRLLG